MQIAPLNEFLSTEIIILHVPTWMSSEGLMWLDGSDVTYSNWLSEPMLETGCGHINTDSGLHWKMTSNCSQEFYFICEFGEFYAFFLLIECFLYKNIYINI